MFPLKDDNPAELPPIITVALIAACVLVFFWQLSLGQAQQAAVFAFGTVPAVLFGLAELPPELQLIPAELTLFTSMFMHGGWMHIIGNMLYLWIFGNNVEDAMGHVRFIVFYLVCGLVAVLAHALPGPESTVPMIGASGAISGVLGAYLLLYPHARVLVAIPFGFIIQTFYLPAVAVLGLWFVIQLLSSATTAGEGGGVAWGAHIGGFVAGMLLVPLFKQRGVPLWQRPGR
ncbi:rhomboid family intramembrane serine protease [Thiohalobacter thiocyanaticus]|uniref:Rhomboid family intramembrane serine protease n=1 Tax=Thiohalobacter thiocyanaticus TaxID=585455 RepID=A0A426QGT7_9GAMM|nr:rhomboid family intramembrane serine protease [Thiohalobacter thiocyanaticus]RRQ20967.1 rhomboid family intramembrane serine protease [Thiohalobacter thiocyanaticus]